MDRNSFYANYRHLAQHVALRKESVDRNTFHAATLGGCAPSLSARRAWIEIANNLSMLYNAEKSLSARRAWIEI